MNGYDAFGKRVFEDRAHGALKGGRLRLDALRSALAGIEPHFAYVARPRRQLLQQPNVGVAAGAVCDPPGMEACPHANVRVAREAFACSHGIMRGDGRAEKPDALRMGRAGDFDSVGHEVEMAVHVDEAHHAPPPMFSRPQPAAPALRVSSTPAIRRRTKPASICPMMGGR